MQQTNKVWLVDLCKTVLLAFILIISCNSLGTIRVFFFMFQIMFRDLSSEMLCGEVQRVTLEFKNTGNAALTALYVASTPPELFSLGETSPQRSGAPQVTQISFPNNMAGQLSPGQTHTVPMWLRAPDTKGTTNLEMLFYYENANGSSNPRYELLFGFYTILLRMFVCL
jgi:hypothetical protein